MARSPASHPAEIHYSFNVADPGVVHITVEMPIAAHGTEVLTLPSRWAGQTELFRTIRNLRALDTNVTLRPTDSPARWLLQSRTGGVARLGYDLVPESTGPMREHRVLVTPAFWEFNGDNALVLPLHRGDDAVHATFDFAEGQPSEREGDALVAAQRGLLTSFGEKTHQEYGGTWSGVANAMFAGGDLRLHRFGVDGESIVLAATPGAARLADELAPRLEALLRAEQRFWGDTPETHPERLGVVLATYDDDREGGSGSAFTGAAALFVPRGERADGEVQALLAHETLHQWLPLSMGYTADTRELAWFAEGFTRFYQEAMLLRAGLLSDSGYLARINTLLRTYRASPRIANSTAASQSVAPGDPFTFEEPYLRGAVLALWLDSTIDQETGGRDGLGDLLRALRAERARPLTAERIFATAARFVDTATLARLRHFALDRAEIPVLPGSLGECVTFQQTPAWTYELGFDAASLEPNGTVHGVDRESNAYAAGVRDGQLLDGWSGWSGDPQREVRLQVLGADGERSRLTFLPHGRAVDVAQGKRIAGCTQAIRIPK